MSLLSKIKEAGLGLIDVLRYGNQEIYETSVRTGTLNFTNETIRYADEMIAAFSDIKTKGENMFVYLSNQNQVGREGIGELDYFKDRIKDLIDFIEKNNDVYRELLIRGKDYNLDSAVLSGYTPATALKMRDLYDNMEKVIQVYNKSEEYLKTGREDNHSLILRQIGDSMRDAYSHFEEICNTDYSKKVTSNTYTDLGSAAKKLFSLESGCYAAAFRDMSFTLS